MQHGRQCRTFRSILTQVESHNQQQLMARARLANRIAKVVGGKARESAYQVKTNALIALRLHFLNCVCITNDTRLPRFLVVNIIAARFTLHAPAEYFSNGRGEQCTA